MAQNLRRFLIGNPLATAEQHKQRLGIAQALTLLSADALSSVAYATEEILLVLVTVGTAGLGFSIPIAGAVSILVVTVVVSYTQVIRAYPAGGGSYTVAKENLGELFGLFAAAGLLVDYVLTVSVSVAAGVAAMVSALPVLRPVSVTLGVLLVGVMTVMHLRGVRESARAVSVLVYGFIGSFLVMLAYGLFRSAFGGPAEALPPAPGPQESVNLGWFLVLHAFASGCTALTGVEAVSNGVAVFRAPEARNARATLLLLGVTLIVLFMGVTYLAATYRIAPSEQETVVSQVARITFSGGLLYFVVQAASVAILILAANTSFADFPRLSSILARDGFMPRQMAHLGDRLVYSNGIILLGVLSALLLVVFEGDTHRLIPLYAIGVFLAFTLSQGGMVLYWWRKRLTGWRASLAVNAVGASVTSLVLLVFTVTKFVDGAWIVFLTLPVIIIMLSTIRNHYRDVAEYLSLADRRGAGAQPPSTPVAQSPVIVPVGGVNHAVLPALAYAQSISKDVRVIHVESDPAETARVRERWERLHISVPLTILPSPYRSVTGPLLDYIDDVNRKLAHGYVTVVLPEFVPRRWWQHLLHNQTALVLKAMLLFRPGVVVVSIPYHLRR